MSKRVSKLNSDQKKELFWSSISTQTLANLRDTLAATGIEAHTRHDESELTSIMEAAKQGKVKSLDTLLDWYDRRRELRTKGWIDLRDEVFGRNALMLAAQHGHVDCVESLLKFGSKLTLKDDAGKTALDIAKEYKKLKVVEFLEMELQPVQVEVLVEEEDGSVLTSTQRSKLKKKELQAQESTFKKPQHNTATTSMTTRDKTVQAYWPELKKVLDDFDALHPVHDVTLTHTDSPDIDPSLFTCHWLRKLTLQMAQLEDLTTEEFSRLSELQQLILSGNLKLQRISSPLHLATKLRVLEIEGCDLHSIDAKSTLNEELEIVNLSRNQLTSLGSWLLPCSKLQSVNVSSNRLTSVEDAFKWTNLPRLAEFKIGRNRLVQLPKAIAELPNLVLLQAEENLIEEIPIEFVKLKNKLKVFVLTGNPLKDLKLAKIVNSKDGGKLKDLFSKLEKVEGRKASTKKKGKKGKKEEEEEEEESELELDDDDI